MPVIYYKLSSYSYMLQAYGRNQV